eukprot:1522214-Prymnesium_polylepis.1
MGLSWLLLAPLGVLVARYGKTALKGGEPAKWFLVHRASQSMAVLMTIVGVVVAIAETDSLFGEHMFNAHTTMGIVVTAIMVIQPLIAIARPAKDAASRPAWSEAHKLLGYATCVCTVVLCVLGADEIGKLYRIEYGKDDSTGDSLVVVFLVLAGVWVVGMCAGEVRRVASGEKSAGAEAVSTSTNMPTDVQDLKVNQC